MSDGKYLINKSSLTGIADAVRNKLGAGKATTDPQTGDIVYPEGKGYYIDSVTTMFIEVPDNNAYSVQPGRSPINTFIRLNTEWDYLKKVEKPVSEVEVEGIFGATVNGRRFKRSIVINSNSFQLDDYNFTDIQNFKQTFDTPQTYLSISISVTNNYNTTQYISWSNVKIYLRDENGNLIDLITSGFPSNGCTIGTTTSQIQKPIPYSVADIKNNIKDYWSVPEGSLEITENGTYDVTDKASAIVNVSSSLETWKWSDTQSTYLIFPSDFSVENLKDITCLSNGYPRGLYKDSLGKPVSMKDQRILLPTSFTMEDPLTVEKISAAHNEGRTFCIPWNWKSGKTKEVPYDVSFVWFVVEPNDSKIYLGAGYYVNYTGNGKWTIIYT